jgi:anaerobic magnesium-protoporphyrin IX monomethyl ester cyclase
MRTLFVQPPMGDGNSRMPGFQRLFPWGFATVARFLEDDGHEIQVLDVYASDLIRTEVEDYLEQRSFESVCITGFASANYLYVSWLAEEIKKRYSVPVIVGGVLADHHFDLLLSKGTIDICVIGEGELTALDLFRNIGNLSTVKGIAYRHDGRIILNEPRDHIENLDSLPMPNFDLWEMERYTNTLLYVHDQSTMYESFDAAIQVSPEELCPNMTVLAGRGCPYKCRFCSRSYNYLRLKSIGRIIDEIKYLKDRYQIRAVHFADELLLVNKKRVLEFCQEIKKLNIFWDGQGRVNLVDKEIMLAMRDASCLSLGLGIESGSNQMLRAMNKGITREQNLRALREAREVGLHLKIQLMGGYPGETKETLAETASLLREAGLPPRRLNWCTPLPGSELYEEAKRQGLIDDEEAYLIRLYKGYNTTDNVVLNFSGNSDAEMIRLLNWVHMKMDVNYLIVMLTQPNKILKPIFWEHLMYTLRAVKQYYGPFFRKLPLIRVLLRYTFSLLYKTISIFRRLVLKLHNATY